jgi:hypothetical protein
VSHSFFDGHQINAILIKMQTESMAETMQVETDICKPNPGKGIKEWSPDRFFANVSAGLLTREEPAVFCGTFIDGSRIGVKVIKGTFRQYRIPVRSILAAGNVNGMFRSEDVAITKTTEFTDPDAGGIEYGELRLMLWVFDGTDNGIYLFFCGNGGKILVKLEKRDFPLVPVLMKNIVKEIPKLGYVDVDGAGV